MDDLVEGAHVEQESSQRTLNLGVTVLPYRSTTKKVRSLTTADVAHFLEAKYSVMEVFYLAYEQSIAHDISESMKGAMEAMIMGAPAIDPFGAAMSNLQSRFKTFISSMEAERSGIAGTPTKAALRGVNHRLKHPYARSNPRRPSFRDTGTYMNSFISWVD